MISDKKHVKIILDFTYVLDDSVILKWLETLEEGDFILYITDDPKKAERAHETGLAVLIYLHENNKHCSFNGFRYFIEGFEDADMKYLEGVYMREKKIPWVICETERLRIREMSMEDIDNLYSLYSDKSVVEYMEDLPADKEEEKRYITEYIDTMYGFYGYGMWLVELREGGEIIGRVGFQNTEKEDVLELGFMIIPEYQRQGYAYEACRGVLKYMQDRSEGYTFVASCHEKNIKALSFCHKLGIKLVPNIRNGGSLVI